jgi:hypothetical protein
MWTIVVACFAPLSVEHFAAISLLAEVAQLNFENRNLPNRLSKKSIPSTRNGGGWILETDFLLSFREE